MVCTKVEKVDRIDGGFVMVPVAELMRAWWACRSRPLGSIDFRAWLGCREMVARRCHVQRDRDRSPRFDFPELAKLLETSERRATASVRKLEAAGLIAWSAEAISFPERTGTTDQAVESVVDTIGRGQGSVAIPRRMLRFLVAGARPAMVASVLGLLLRCLSRRKDGWNSRGRAKARWIALAFGMSDRQIKSARAELVAMGWLTAEDSAQWSMNRWGRGYQIDLGWTAPARDNGQVSSPKSAHPPGDSGAVSSPPDSDQEPLRERMGNQEPGLEPAGVETRKRDEERQTTEPPRLADIQVADLKDTGRLLQLHDQAVAKGLVTTAEADRLRVVASAEHALAVGKSNPAGLFAWLVRNRAWRYLTGEDEDRANSRIKASLRGSEPPRAEAVAGTRSGPLPVSTDPPASQPASISTTVSGRPGDLGRRAGDHVPFGGLQGFGPGNGDHLEKSRVMGSDLSEDARIVKEIRALFIRSGIYRDPWPMFATRNPGWDRARWDRAMVELRLA